MWLRTLLPFAFCAACAGTEPTDTATSAVQGASLKIDLAGGKVVESNCVPDQASACAHKTVVLDGATFSSTDTAFTFEQHVLSLQLQGLGVGRQGLHHIAFDYEMRNPTGQENNLLCVLVTSDRVERKCVGGIAPSGRLTVPFHAQKAGFDLELGFGTMPLARGNSFSVSNVVLVDGAEPNVSKLDTVNLDLRTAQPYQRDCDVPLGCSHAVKVGAGEFRSTIIDSGVMPGGRLALSVPIPEDKSRTARSITFRYSISGDGALEVSARVKGRTVVGTIKGAGTGKVELELPNNTAPDSVEVAVVPGGAGSETAVTDLAIAAFEGPSEPAPRDPFDCRGVEGGAAADPCGFEFDTYFVTDESGNRTGHGIRCVSLDRKAFYGEGWWVATDLGQYRSMGVLRPDGTGAIIDLGVRRRLRDDGATPTTTDLGTGGRRDLVITRIGDHRIYVTASDGSIDETWEHVPKSRALPECYVPVKDDHNTLPEGAWDGRCGSFGVVSYGAWGMPIWGRKQCALSGDGEATVNGVSRPAVWFGRSRVGSARGDAQHLGWRARTGEFAFRAATLCLPGTEFGCPRSMDNIDIHLWRGLLTPSPSPEVDFLQVVGPNQWAERNVDAVLWHGLVWVLDAGLPGGASLPPPRPVCPPTGCV